MARLPGAKNKVRVDLTLSSWYSEKIKELRVDTGFESDQGFCTWLIKNTVQVLVDEREPTNQKLSDLRVRMEEALATIEAPVSTHE